MSLGTYAEVGKLVGGGVIGDEAREGISVKMTEDSNFLFVGGPYDNGQMGAVWFYQKVNGLWTQKQKIVPSGVVATQSFGSSLAVNPSMTTLIVGATGDVSGGVFVYTFDGTTWVQQGSKVVGYGSSGGPRQGASVAVSADGNTMIVGGPNDSASAGASWIFVRIANNWAQQGPKLAPSDRTGSMYIGYVVALTSDGNLAVMGGQYSNGFWVYNRVGTVWTQYSTKITGTTGVGAPSNFANSLALSGNDQTLFVGGNVDTSTYDDAVHPFFTSTVWTFKRSGNTFVQQQTTVVAGVTRTAYQAFVLASNKPGSVFAVGALFDASNRGAVYMYGFDGTLFNLIGTKITAADVSSTATTNQGYTVSLDSSGSQLLFSSPNDGFYGAAWVYSNAAITSSPSFAPTAPTVSPTRLPTIVPTIVPTTTPTITPSITPTVVPTVLPSQAPTVVPTILPSTTPSVTPSQIPTVQPTVGPTATPTAVPSQTPTAVPTILPSTLPTMEPTLFPTFLPTGVPNLNPTTVPSRLPTNQPSIKPSLAPIALTGAATTSSLDMLSIVIIAVIGGLALICTLLLIRYRLSRNYREADTAIGEMNEWIEDAKTNANHGSYIQLQHSSKQAKAEDPLLTDIYADNKRSDEML